jgi:hypothetical protein
LIGDLLTPKCAAFPAGIPEEITSSQVDHRLPFPGDLSIQFEPKTPEDAKYAETMFEGK